MGLQGEGQGCVRRLVAGEEAHQGPVVGVVLELGQEDVPGGPNGPEVGHGPNPGPVTLAEDKGTAQVTTHTRK